MGAGEQEGLGRESLPVERDTPGRVKAAGRQSALHGGGGEVSVDLARDCVLSRRL